MRLRTPTELRGATESQQKVYKFLFKFFEENERFPTYREIMRVFGHTSPSGIQSSLEGLREKGLISWEYNRQGTLRISGYRIVLQKIEEGANEG